MVTPIFGRQTTPNITPNKIAANSRTSKTKLEFETEIINILRVNAPLPTYVIANSIGMRGKTSKVRWILKKMNGKGLVKKHHSSHACNSIWELP